MAIGQGKWKEARTERKRLLRSLRTLFKQQRRRVVLKNQTSVKRYATCIQESLATSDSPLTADRAQWAFEYRGNPRDSR